MAVPQAEQQLQHILTLKQTGEIEEAIAQLHSLLHNQPKFVRGWLELGNLWRIQKNSDKARSCFCTLLDIAPKNLWGNVHLAHLLAQAGDTETAEYHLKTALEAHPQHPIPWLRLGELALDRQQWETALTWFDQAIAADPNPPEAYIKKTTALLRLQQWDAAEANLECLLERHPHYFWGLFQRGQLERQRSGQSTDDSHQWARSLHWFRLALAKAPNASQQHTVQLCILEDLHALGQWDDAIVLAQEMMHRWPKSLQVKLLYGSLLKDQGKQLEAIAIYETILAHQPIHKQASARLHAWAMELGNTPAELAALQRIHAHFERICQQQDETKRLLQLTLRLGDRYQQRQDETTAQQHFQRILDLDPHHLWANLKVAIADRHAGHFDAAESRLQHTLNHHPHHAVVLMALGDLERSRQRPEVALEYFQQAHAAQPDRLDAAIKSLTILRELQQLDAAIHQIESLTAQYPNDPRILIQRGLLHRQQNQQQQALAQFRTAHTLALQSSASASIHESRWLIIEALRDLGRLNEAQREIQASSVDFQQHTRTRMLLGQILQRQDEMATAAELYRSLLQEQPHHTTASLELARCLSQLGQTTEAIALLQSIHSSMPGQQMPHPGIPLLLAQIYHGLQDFEQSQHWYKLACQAFPHHPGGYCGLSEALFQQGEYAAALHCLTQAQAALPHEPQIPIKQAQIAQRWGEVEHSYAVLAQARQQFPDHVPLLLELGQLHIRCGNFGEAIALLDTIDTNNQTWHKRLLNQRGDIALQSFQLDQAEHYYIDAIALPPPQQQERLQLARIYLLQGDLDAANDQLAQATQALEKKRPPGQVGLPIKNHIATLINEFRLNPLRLAQLKQIQQDRDGRHGAAPFREESCLLALASLITEEPSYLGAIIHLARELHMQGIWAKLRHALTVKAPNRSPIPPTIIQFWDDPEPPPSVQQLGQTWVKFNPDYTYKRFALKEAIAFLQQQYDPHIVQAFRLCGHPASQADFFRLAYLNCYGGFYADADDRCRQSLEPLRQSKAELVLYHEDFACFGNNFLGCVPHHPMIRSALYQAAANLLNYSAESAWSQTGPGLLTSAVCSGLLPYLAYDDYRLWPRLLVLSRAELAHYVWSHISLPYKKTEKSWQNQAYPKTLLDQKLV